MSALIAMLGGVRAAWFAACCLLLWLALLAVGYRLASVERELAEEKLKVATITAEIATQRAEFEAAARKQEEQHAHDFQMFAEEFRRGRRDAQSQIDQLLAGLRDGTERLRGRFQCPPGAGPGVPQGSAVPGGDPGAGGAGFTEADARVAFGIARDGDDAIRKLAACQAILKSLRPQPAGG